MEINAILLYENEQIRNLYPFSILHCGWELRCGCFRLFEKVQQQFPEAKLHFYGRKAHLDSFLARFQKKNENIGRQNLLIINSAVLPETKLWKSMQARYIEQKESNPETKSALFTKDGFPFAIYLPKEEIINPLESDKPFLIEMLERFYDVFPKIEVEEARIINYLWDAIYENGRAIDDDALFFTNFANLEELKSKGVFLVQKDKIKISKSAQIAPLVVLDASGGHIVIDDNAKIMAHCTIVGPCYIGKNSIIKAGAKIYEKTSIGETCKVGGEVENSIVHAYSNKQHEGFLGHSYICEWVNLGADTNTSDLKNTYSNIKVWLEGREIDTRKMFLGLLCGDHTKSAINTSFTTGTVAGICGILVHDGFLPNSIPSFAWTGRRNSPIYKLSKALEVARIVMQRRNKTLTAQEEYLISVEYEKIIGEKK
jgi:UDP-N-acetylglucosamine diphosphorylase/glucosamine-1-phosphate N-acetyltransferase